LFLAKAVRWLAEQGVTQFLDLGCGLPTGQNTHEIAQGVRPDCRVVYVDADPIVLAHARALLRAPGVTAIRGDMAKPDAILADLRAMAREYQAGTLYNHSFKQVAAFVEDLELIPPGVTDAMAWIPGSPSQSPPPQSGGRILAGVARKPDAGTRASPRV
jgi:hypothetical protein